MFLTNVNVLYVNLAPYKKVFTQYVYVLFVKTTVTVTIIVTFRTQSNFLTISNKICTFYYMVGKLIHLLFYLIWRSRITWIFLTVTPKSCGGGEGMGSYVGGERKGMVEGVKNWRRVMEERLQAEVSRD